MNNDHNNSIITPPAGASLPGRCSGSGLAAYLENRKMGRKEDLRIRIQLKLSDAGYDIDEIRRITTSQLRRKTIAQLSSVLRRIATIGGREWVSEQ